MKQFEEIISKNITWNLWKVDFLEKELLRWIPLAWFFDELPVLLNTCFVFTTLEGSQKLIVYKVFRYEKTFSVIA